MKPAPDRGVENVEAGKVARKAVKPAPDLDVEDVSRIPQRFEELPALKDGRTAIAEPCRSELVDEFEKRFFAPWTSAVPLFDPAESKSFMEKVAGRGNWVGVNKRKVSRKLLQKLLENCDLEGFPSRNELAIAVAPGHLRGLPTPLPLYENAQDAPFDMLSYPQLKLNDPLRVLHTSRDGSWLFVESAYSNGWIARRDVALVGAPFAKAWMQKLRLVVVRDYAAVPDGRGVATFQTKIGTMLPVSGQDDASWEVLVASAGEGGKAETRTTRIPKRTAAPFPLEFNKENIALIGDDMLGQPYGWGELYDLRDCSALLRDFFAPFGIWLPRTSSDQIASVKPRVELAALSPSEKEQMILAKAVPFLTLLHKRGHIMLYAGTDREGRPLAFHGAWSIRVKDGDEERTQMIGGSVITTLKPGDELGLVPGGSLLEKATDMGTVTGRCQKFSSGRLP